MTDNPARVRRVAIVGAGISGLAAAWTLNQHPDRFDFRVFEARDEVGGNAITADMPQADGTSIPFDISVTALIPSVYQHVLLVMEQYGIELLPTRFNYGVKYGDGIYGHDIDSDLRQELAKDIEKFRKLLRRLNRFGALTRSRSRLLNALNPYNYISMGRVLKMGRFSDDFKYKILKPMFVNFLMATNVFDMPAALFARYLEFFNIETATTMHTWDQGTRRIYENMSSGFRDKIYLNRPVKTVHRSSAGVVIEDENGAKEEFDDVILACNANQSLGMLDEPSRMERYILSRVRYDSSLHGDAIIHSDASVLPDDAMKGLETRSNYIEHYGEQADNYQITYVMHNQQPWANGSDKPCLVTYNAVSPIDESKIIRKMTFQHVVHDVKHVAVLVQLFRYIQGRNHTWHAGAHTLINSQETCFVTGLAAARQLGADYPLDDEEARQVFNYYGSMMYGRRFRKVRRDQR